MSYFLQDIIIHACHNLNLSNPGKKKGPQYLKAHLGYQKPQTVTFG